MKQLVLVMVIFLLLVIFKSQAVFGKMFGENYGGVSHLIQKKGNTILISSPGIWGYIKNCNWTRTKIDSKSESIVTNGRVNEEFYYHFMVYEYSEDGKPSCMLQVRDADVNDTAKYECQLKFNNESEIREKFVYLFIQDENIVSELVGHMQEADHAVLLYKNVDVNQKDVYIPDLSIQEIELQCVSHNKIQLIHILWNGSFVRNRDIRDTKNVDKIFKTVTEEDLKRGNYSVECTMQPENLHLSTKLIFPHPVRHVEMKEKKGSDSSSIELECIPNGYPFPRSFGWMFKRCIKDNFSSEVFHSEKNRTIHKPGVYSCKTGNVLNRFPKQWIKSNEYRFCPDIN